MRMLDESLGYYIVKSYITHVYLHHTQTYTRKLVVVLSLFLMNKL